MDHPPPSLDHIILLIPDSWHSNPPAALTQIFTLYPGGTHADNKTRNTLIILPSGTYLELISFIPPEDRNREGHWWGTKPPGFIDWCLGSSDPSSVDRAKENLRKTRSKWNFEEPKRGGRKRPDGVEMKWEVTFPSKDVARGVVPFWCFDVTPRERRVPMEEAATRHPCGAESVELCLIVGEGEVRRWAGVYESIMGVQARPGEDGRMVLRLTWPGDGGEGRKSKIVVREAKDEWEESLLKASGQEAVIGKVVVICRGNEAGEMPKIIDDSVIKDCGFRIEFSGVD